MSKLKYITFILENCERITIDGKYVASFLVDDIKTSISRMALNYIGRMDTVNTFAIEIHRDANDTINPFGDPNLGQYLKFDRLARYDDITSIEFELYDNDNDWSESHHYYVNWVGDDDYENDAQKSYLSKDNNLYIVIADGKNVEDFFDTEEINDSEYMDSYFLLLEVGNKYGSQNDNL